MTVLVHVIAFVLFDRDELDRIGANTTFVPPEFLRNVPANWQKRREKDNATLYWVPSSPFPD